MTTQSPVLQQLKALCAIPSYHDEANNIDEAKIAAFLTETIAHDFPWLHVHQVDIGNGMHYVFAYDGDPANIRLLIAGHLDTVCPSVNWTDGLHGTVHDGKYYHLGAADTKAGIAATLCAMREVGPTKGVGYLFYGDEEYNFNGMDRFVKDWPQVQPAFALSLCGGYAEAVTACRGCIEIELVVEGVSGHASRPHKGSNAILAIQHVVSGLERFCHAHSKTALAKTSFNIGGLIGGSLTKTLQEQHKGGIAVQFSPNKIANAAWAVIDVRPGTPPITAQMLSDEAKHLMETFNLGADNKAKFHSITVNFDRGSYFSTEEAIDPIFRAFQAVHGGTRKEPEGFGYIDVAELAVMHGTALMCLSPKGENPHGKDEYVEIASLEAYVQCCKELLRTYQT